MADVTERERLRSGDGASAAEAGEAARLGEFNGLVAGEEVASDNPFRAEEPVRRVGRRRRAPGGSGGNRTGHRGRGPGRSR